MNHELRLPYPIHCTKAQSKPNKPFKTLYYKAGGRLSTCRGGVGFRYRIRDLTMPPGVEIRSKNRRSLLLLCSIHQMGWLVGLSFH